MIPDQSGLIENLNALLTKVQAENERYRAALEEIAEGCGHARCHAYRWIRLADKALRGK